MDKMKDFPWTEHGKIICLLGYYEGKADSEEDEVFARLFRMFAENLRWGLGMEDKEK